MANYVQMAVEAILLVRGQLIRQLEQIDASLAALGEGTTQKRSARSRKPCCTKDEVIEILAALLRDNGSLTRNELEELAKDEVSTVRQKSLSGFAMRLQEALADPQFQEVAPGEYRLIPRPHS